MPDAAVQSKDKTQETAETSPQSPGFLRAGLLVACSALFGGIAVVIWNRRTLAQMQTQTSEPVPLPPDDEDAVY